VGALGTLSAHKLAERIGEHQARSMVSSETPFANGKKIECANDLAVSRCRKEPSKWDEL
jgi:hypothetical protein